jgi:hypothetical protein
MGSEKYTNTFIFLRLVFAGVLFAFCTTSSGAEKADGMSAAVLDKIGRRIWQNECAGTVDGLTSWNAGENFASLGIGHFIWYPAGVEGPFEESFPKLKAWFQSEGVALPKWVLAAKDCPWPDKKSFERAHDSAEQKDLRKLLSTTLPQQTRFIIHRLDEAVPKYRRAAGSAGGNVEKNVALLKKTPAGNFAMIDYVNFKGEGLNPKERYKGEGWGLLQVLIDMRAEDAGSAPSAFAEAAKRTLTRRVANSPPERNEGRWLPGWKSRCDDYRK